MVMDRKTPYCKCFNSLYIQLQSRYENVFFIILASHSKIIWKTKGSVIDQTFLKKNNIGVLALLGFQTYKADIIKIMCHQDMQTN